jgi:Zn-dependent M32 family carboxypeptidase
LFDNSDKFLNWLNRDWSTNESAPSKLVTSRVKIAKLAEAISTAERDKAIEMLTEMESSTKLDKQLLEHLKTYVADMNSVLEARDTDINGISRLLENTRNENSKLRQNITSITKKLSEQTIKYKQSISEANNINNQYKKQFIDYLLEKVQFNLGDNSKALLESCDSITETIGVFEQIIESARVDALHPKLTGDISIRSIESNTKKSQIKEAIRKVKG